MSRFVIYDPITGVLTRIGQCQDHDLALQAQAGEAMLDVTEVWWAQMAWPVFAAYHVDLATKTLVPN